MASELALASDGKPPELDTCSETALSYLQLAQTEDQLRSFSYVRPWLAGLPVLDLGCAKGVYLRQFAADSVGIDVSLPNLEHCRHLGLNVRFADLNRSLPLDTEKMPAIFCSHVLEHVDAPIALLRECHRLLRPDGLLVLGLPIEGNFVNRVRRQHYFAHHPGHLYSFSLDNIRALLQKIGFKTLRFYFEPRIIRIWPWPAMLQWLPAHVAHPFALAYWVVAQKAGAAPRSTRQLHASGFREDSET